MTKSLRLPPAPVADRRLLDLLQSSGKISAAVLPAVERAMATRNLSAIDALVETGALVEGEIARVAATELKLPLVDLRATPPADDARGLLAKSTAEHYGLLPARVRGDTLVVAMVNPCDQEALAHVRSLVKMKVQPVVATRTHVLEAIERLYVADGALGVLLNDVPSKNGVAVLSAEVTPNIDPSDVEAVAREAEQAPVVKMVNLILYEAFNAHASDVHIEPGPNLVVVRFRIDGILQEHLQMPKWVQAPVVARIKVMSKLDIAERRVPQDGHLGVRVREKSFDVRVSTMPTTFGEKIVMRLLDPDSGPRRLSEIGLSDRDLAMLRNVISRPEGMILVTGPTGSGKTTTIYAAIQDMFSPELNIVTIENPVEYELEGVSQISINEKQGLTFAEVLRSVLRQDPDVILVGEIRDPETAEIAFQAAQTGHLVFSTVHTNDSVATVTRLFELGIEPQVLGPSLLAVVAQRLVRKNCPACSQPEPADDAARRTLALPPGTMLRAGKGCPLCRDTGFSGRTGCYEVLMVSKGITRLIEQRAADSAIRALAEDEGMVSLVDDAREKVLAGITTPAEVLRVVEVEQRGPICPSCHNAIEANFTVCPYCKNPLRVVCSGCGAVMKKKWATCPFCGTDVAPPARNARLLPEPVRGEQPLGEVEVPRILAVDDDPDVLEILRLTLTRGKAPFDVQTARGGEEALAKVKTHRPHLVILDVMMPGMDGFEVCRRLRADLSTALIPIIMLTALGDTDSKRMAFLVGTDDYVVKPFERPELLARVHRLLERNYRWTDESVARVAEPRAREPQRPG